MIIPLSTFLLTRERQKIKLLLFYIVQFEVNELSYYLLEKIYNPSAR